MLYIFIAVILTIIIETVRIKSVHGVVQKINPIYTYLIGAVFFVVCLLVSDRNWFLLLVNYVCLRAAIYSPLLNLLRGKYIFYASPNPDKLIDRFLKENNIKPQLFSLFFLVIYILTLFL
jgi:hypothetical protein